MYVGPNFLVSEDTTDGEECASCSYRLCHFLQRCADVFLPVEKRARIRVRNYIKVAAQQKTYIPEVNYLHPRTEINLIIYMNNYD